MTAPHTPRAVSVIATVFNEADHIDRLLDSLAAQTRPPDELVIVDGGSADDTLARLRARAARGDLHFPLHILARPGANISAGRNAAIAAARGPFIATTDAGVRLAPAWLAELAGGFDAAIHDSADTPHMAVADSAAATPAQVVSGFFASEPEGPFETALGATTLPEVADVDPARFLPSSRSVAFLKAAWAAAGGYPEWLDYCEDLVFDLRLMEQSGPAAFVPAAMAWFRPRPNLGAFARQYYLYARGDGKADLWIGRHAVRYGTYLLALPTLTTLALVHHPIWWLVLAGGLAGMLRTPYRRLGRQWALLSAAERLQAILWVPLIRVTGDLAKMLGYPIGCWWRWRHRPPAWRLAPEMGRW